MKKFVSVISVVVAMGAPIFANAQAKPRPQPQDSSLERRISVLENQNERQANRIQNINQRLRDVEQYLEQLGGDRRPPRGGENLGIACMLIDTGYGKAHVGTGSSNLDAEYQAHKTCESSTHSSYCTKGKLECEVITSYSKSVCVLTDKGYGKRHRGEGDNEVLAKASAIKKCGVDTHSSYCTGATIQCENVY